MKEIPPSHQIESISRTNSLPLCESHNKRNEFYCQKCEAYLCKECVQQPLHSNNPEHVVRPI